MGRSGAARRHARMAHASAPAAAHAAPHPAGQTPQRATTPPQQQPPAAFLVDDASTWVAFLRCSSEPYLDFYVALKQRFAVPWTQAGTAAERASLHRSLLSLSVLVLGLVAAKSDAELESALTACRAAYEVLVDTDRAAQRRGAQSSTAPKTTVAAPAPQRQQQQQAQPSAAFTVDDISTWTQFMQSTPNPKKDFRAALEKRFSSTLLAFSSEQLREQFRSIFDDLVRNAMRLRTEKSRSKISSILEESSMQLYGLKTVESGMKDQPPPTNGPPSNSVPSVMPPTASTLTPLPPLPDFDDDFDIDDPGTWANSLRQRPNPYQDLLDALQHRFVSAVRIAEGVGKLQFVLDKFSALAIRAVDLILPGSKARYEDVLAECRIDFTLLWRLERRLCKSISANLARQSQPERFRSFSTPASPQGRGQRSPPSRKSSLPSSIPAGYEFRVDDPDTWLIFFTYSLKFIDDFGEALQRRFHYTLEAATEPEQHAWVIETFNFLIKESIGVFLAESPAEAELVKRLCKIPLKKLIEVDSQLRENELSRSSPDLGGTQEGSQHAQPRPTGRQQPQPPQRWPSSGSATFSERYAGAGAESASRVSAQAASLSRNPFENLGKYESGFYPEDYDESEPLWESLCDYVFIGGDADDWFEDNGFTDKEATR